MTSYTPNLRLAMPPFDKRQWHDEINNNMRILDALWAKFFATSGLVGVWLNATMYAAGVLVVDADAGTIWRCEVPHTTPTSGTFLDSRTANPTYWSNYTIGVRYKGAWSSGNTYAVGDFIVANSSYFAVANLAHTAASAFAVDYTAGKWEVLIDTSSAMSSINAAVSTATAAAAQAAAAASNLFWCGTGAGADDVVLTCSLSALTDGVSVEWRQVSNNTTTVRLNPNGLGLVALLDANGVAIAEADTLRADRIYRAKYSTTTNSWELMGPQAIIVGKHVFPVHANAMILNTNSSPTSYSTITVTNAAMINGLSFNSTGLQYAEFEIPMPKSLATAGTISYRVRWTATAGTAASTCIWQLAAVGIGDGDALDVAPGTAVDVTDLLQNASLRLHVSPESTAVTINSFASEDTVRFRLNRKITGNTLTTPAILLGVEIFLNIYRRNDA